MVNIKWHIKQTPNMLVRVVTGDRFYVCDECHKLHRRDGTEVRLDIESGGMHLMSNPIWYGSVKSECYDRLMNNVRTLLFSDAIENLNK